jgi:hypothetical protein
MFFGWRENPKWGREGTRGFGNEIAQQGFRPAAAGCKTGLVSSFWGFVKDC